MSGPKKYLRTENGERIDQPDFEHAAEESQLAGLTQLGDAMLVGSDARAADTTGASLTTPVVKQFVLEGFAPSYSSPNITIGTGAAILSWRDEGEVEHGAIVELASDQIITVSTTLSGSGETFGVYVRFNLQDDQFQNRNFWNSLAATPVETARKIATRRVDSVQVNISAASPGDEWMLLATFVPTGALTDRRQFYFEGAAGNGIYTPDYKVVEWGDGTNDRNADRALYGVKGLRTFARAVQRQLEDIIGTGKWFQEVSSEQNINNLETNKLDNRGSNASIVSRGKMYGDLDPSSSDTYDLGAQATPWANINAGSIYLGLERLASAANASLARLQFKATSSYATKLLQSIIGSLTPDDTTVEFLHLPSAGSHSLPGGSHGSFAIVLNCTYVNTATAPTSVWTRYDNTYDALLLEFGTGGGSNVGFRIWSHSTGFPNSWDNAVGGTNWTQLFHLGEATTGNAELAGTLDVSGAITGASTIAATGNISTSANVSAVDVVASDDVTAANAVLSSLHRRGELLGAFGRMYQSSVPRQIGTATVTTTGGVVSAYAQINGRFTATEVDVGGTGNNNTVRVTLDASETDFSSTTSYVVFATATGYTPIGADGTGLYGVPVGTSTFDLYFGTNTGGRVPLSTASAGGDITIQFITYGF